MAKVPLQSYYPSARVRLGIRFEDFGRSPNKPPETIPQLRRGKKDTGTNLRIERDGTTLVLLGEGDRPNANGTPQQQRTSSDGYTHWVDGIIPVTAAWSQNGIRTADTLNLEFEFGDMPIDPRSVRSCAVQYFLGTVSPEDFQRGIAGERRTTGVPPGSNVRYNVVPDEYTDPSGARRTNLRFEGWVDSWTAEWPENEAPKIVLECTDNTRILIEQMHPTKLAVSVDDPIDMAVAVYLSNFPQFRGIGVQYRPAGSTAPKLATALSKGAYPPGVGPSAAKAGDSKLSVWDYLTDVVKSVGLNIRLDGTTVIIETPRSLYNRRFPPRSGDPFQGRAVDNVGSGFLDHRLMIYGQNVLEMQWHREFTRYAPLNVEVRSYFPKRKKTLIARFPRTDDRGKRLQPGDSTDEKWEVLSVPGIGDEAVLRSIAQQLYEVLGRNELMVSVVTKNLGSYGGGNLDPDLLDMRIGDAVDVVVQRGNLDIDDHNTVTTIQGQLARRPEQFLEELGFPTPFAKAYAAAMNDVNLTTTFRLKEIHIDWDKTADGVRIDFDAVNYVEVRADAELPEGEEQAPAPGEPESPPVVVEDQVES
jgi:hypothetical protein